MINEHETVAGAMCRCLPRFLPRRGQPAAKGPELVGRLLACPDMPRASENTLTYHLSMLSKNPETCIEKCPNAQGYHLRPEVERGWGRDRVERAERIEVAARSLAAAIRSNELMVSLLDLHDDLLTLEKHLT